MVEEKETKRARIEHLSKEFDEANKKLTEKMEFERLLTEYYNSSPILITTDYPDDSNYFVISDLDGNLIVSLTKDEYEHRMTIADNDYELFIEELLLSVEHKKFKAAIDKLVNLSSKTAAILVIALFTLIIGSYLMMDYIITSDFTSKSLMTIIPYELVIVIPLAYSVILMDSVVKMSDEITNTFKSKR